jgi:hypothetical protein
MWLAFPIVILPFVILERVKIKEEKKKTVTHRTGKKKTVTHRTGKKKTVTHRTGKAFESDRSRHPE